VAARNIDALASECLDVDYAVADGRDGEVLRNSSVARPLVD
jgi:hypothetical protein